MSDTPDTPSRRHRRRGTLGKKERRNVFLFLAASGVAALLIFGAALLRRDAPQIMPLETPEELAMRSSPDNAFPLLAEAVALLPKSPGHRMVEEEDGLRYAGPYRPAAGSLGQMLNIGRTDTDPEFVEYLDSARPALDKMREALDKPFMRLPTPEHWEYGNVGAGIAPLAHLAVANALYDVRYRSSEPQSPVVLDILRLGELVSQDGGFAAYPIAVDTQTLAMRHAWELALESSEPGARFALLDTMASHSLASHSLRPQLEYEWRMFDRPDAFDVLNQDPFGTNQGMRRPDNIVERMFIGRMLHRMRLKMIENRDLYLKAADLAIEEVDDFSEGRRQLTNNAPHFDPIHRIFATDVARKGLSAWLRGWRIVAQLEAYQLANGDYPETLEAASVDIQDPFTKSSYVYRKFPNDFTLYSVGIDAVDNGGAAWQDRDIVLRRAAAEPDLEMDNITRMGLRGALGRRGRSPDSAP